MPCPVLSHPACHETAFQSHAPSVTYPASPYVSVVRLQAPSCCELSSRVEGQAEEGMRWLSLLWGGLRLEEGEGELLS